MASIPTDRIPDSTLPFLRDPYRFIGKRAAALDSDVISTRLLGQRTICMYGQEAGQLFYDTARMQRAGAMPRRVIRTLLGQGGVQGFDGEAHRVRKALFLELATGEGLQRLIAIAERHWHEHVHAWQASGSVRLYPAVADILASSAFEWVGLPLTPDVAPDRIRDVVALFDGAGAVGPRHWKARRARRHSERWLGDVIGRIRSGAVAVDYGAPVARIARHLDADGELLPSRTAAVEVLNLVRPVTAVAVYVSFVAHALHTHTAARDAAAGDDRAVDCLVDEVRRFYPFFPAVAARTCEAFSWKGLDFPAGVRVMYDLYGTSHDPRLWHRPDVFDPLRFETAYDPCHGLVPQGGGGHADGHRCPGEWITRALMAQAARMLHTALAWRVIGDAAIDFARVPALPAEGMLIEGVRLRG